LVAMLHPQRSTLSPYATLFRSPKPDAPREIRGEYDPIATKVPGIFFSKHVTKLAGIADKLAVVRSIQHNQGNHGAGNHYMMTGRSEEHTSELQSRENLVCRLPL